MNGAITDGLLKVAGRLRKLSDGMLSYWHNLWMIIFSSSIDHGFILNSPRREKRVFIAVAGTIVIAGFAIM